MAGWVLFDGSCGFCRNWVVYWAPTLRRRGFEIAALQEPWVKERLCAPSEDELLSDFRLLLSDARQLRGADAYRYLMRRIWWAYPIYLLAVTPILRQVFDWGYRAFADNRYHISRSCRLPDRQ
jgi:predicted DCC family thiol-disulfide oxidoreductase YuxK